MPPKQVVCSICGVSVLKAQTYSIGKTRACKIHEGVQEKKDELVNKDRNRIENMINEKRRASQREMEQIERRLHPIQVPMGPSCWCCGKPGMLARDYYLELFFATEVLFRYKGGVFNIFDPEPFREYFMRKMGKLPNPIFLVPIEKFKKRKDVRLLNDMKVVLQISNFVAVCINCIEKHKAHEFYPEPPKVKDLSSLFMLGDLAKEVYKKNIEDAYVQFVEGCN